MELSESRAEDPKVTYFNVAKDRGQEVVLIACNIDWLRHKLHRKPDDLVRVIVL